MIFKYGMHNELILKLKVGDKISYSTTEYKTKISRWGEVVYMSEWFMCVKVKVKGGEIRETIPYFDICTGDYKIKGVKI